MAKTTDLNSLPLTQETPAMQTAHETFNAFLNAPVTKLDADEYMAADLDGVTESLLGSGNLNFLMMQAGQTNEEIISRGDSSEISETSFGASPLFGELGSRGVADSGAQADTAMDRGFDMPSLGLDDGNSGYGGQNTATSLGASSLASNSSAAMPLTDSGAFTRSTSLTQPPPGNGNNGTSGISGNNGLNGKDGTPGGDTTINNTNIYNIDPPDNLFTTINNITDNTTEIVTNVTNNLTDIVNNFFENGLDLGPIGISLDATLDEVLGLGLDLISGDSILNVLDETLNLAPVLDPIEGLVGDILADISLDAILDPFQYDNSASDFDLHLGTDLNLLGMNLALPSIDIPLDPVEFLLGDIDIGLDIGEDLLDLPFLNGGGPDDTDLGLGNLEQTLGLAPVIDLVESVVNPVEDLVGDLDILGNLHVDLLNLGQDGTGADTDLILPMDIDLVDSNLLNNGLEIGLDPIEALVGDIDLDLTVAGDVLGNVADGLIDLQPGGTGEDNIIADIGDVATDLVDGIIGFDNNAGDQDLALDVGANIIGLPVNEAANLVLDPVENLLGDVDIGAGLGIDLLDTSGIASPTDTDLDISIDPVAGILPATDIPVNLDFVEVVTGDIDLDLDVTSDLLTDPLGTTEDLLTAGLPNTVDDVLSSAQDVFGGFGNVDELISDLTHGDVDGAIGEAVTLLDALPVHSGGLDLSALLPESGGGGGGESILPSWTETLLPDAGDALGGGLLDNAADIMPDPVSILPALSLPTVPVLPVLPVGGGLFGGHHAGGGLFG